MISLRKRWANSEEIAGESGDSDLETGQLPKGQAGKLSWGEPELDSDDDRVINMHDGIRKILTGQCQTAQGGTVLRKAGVKKAVSIPQYASPTLQCGKILKVDVEPRLVVITVEKLNGERRQLRIEARTE